jgi:hypothetical protein
VLFSPSVRRRGGSQVGHDVLRQEAAVRRYAPRPIRTKRAQKSAPISRRALHVLAPLQLPGVLSTSNRKPPLRSVYPAMQMRPSAYAAVYSAEWPYHPELRRILLLRSLQRFGKAPRVLSRRKQGRSAWSFSHHAILLSGQRCDSGRSSPRLVASLGLIENKGYECLTEVFGPLWLIPLVALHVVLIFIGVAVAVDARPRIAGDHSYGNEQRNGDNGPEYVPSAHARSCWQR